jgi:oxygen-dependent protoporphyrinogen oxidase
VDLEADGLCLCVSAPKASTLLRPHNGLLADLLESIRSISTATLHLAYPRGAIQHPLDGFGFVVPFREGRALSGCTFSSVKFPGRAPDGYVLLRAFVAPSFVSEEESMIVKRVGADLREFLGITGESLWTTFGRQRESMPLYATGHLEKMRSIQSHVHSFPSLVLAGNAYGGVGLPDCILSGESAAESLIKKPPHGLGPS